VAKPEWGAKRICNSCATKFYDFQKSPIICPKCGEKLDADGLLKSRRSRAPTKAATRKTEKAPAESKAIDPEAEVEEGDELAPASGDDDLLMDADIDDDDEEVTGLVHDDGDDNE
jgi:uncharacterized protein (TIGR02300 family)